MEQESNHRDATPEEQAVYLGPNAISLPTIFDALDYIQYLKRMVDTAIASGDEDKALAMLTGIGFMPSAEGGMTTCLRKNLKPEWIQKLTIIVKHAEEQTA